MAITRSKKEAQLTQYAKNLEKSSALFLTNYQGLTANEMNTLRKKLREADGGYTIVKNTLAKKALSEAGLTGVEDLLEGPVGTSFSYGDPPPVAKALVGFAKDVEVFSIKGGLLGEVILTEETIKNLADLPPMEVIRAQLLGVISAPATQLAGILAGGVRQVVNVVQAYADSGEEEAAAA